ncbi:MAG: hypothetical protein CMJ19_16455 [Phycisphaeraceae bacterium]|nr:hypothetical protein [Phycisphaeraceae bacterium]
MSLCTACAGEPVTIQIDPTQQPLVSQLQLGVTHTHVSTDHKDAKPAAVDRAIATIKPVIKWQNTHIIGWGPHDINPKPGVYDWSTLDQRMEHMKRFDAPNVITLCTAPGWMKRHGKTWEMGDRPKAEHFDDFAMLCVEVAKRYPHVRHYQVWNEFKGFWSVEKNAWDVELYTEFYNKVYSALKAHDPTLQVGGFYLVVSGTGSNLPGIDTGVAILNKERRLFEYWIKHKVGADFICVDKAIKDYHDKNEYTADDLLGYTDSYQRIAKQIHEMCDLPIWWAEYYGIGGPKHGITMDQQTVGFASIYYHMITGGTSVGLLWNPVQGEVAHALVTDVRQADGGQELPHTQLMGIINTYFGKGTSIYPITSSDNRVEAIVSSTHVLLINKKNTAVSVTFAGKTIAMDAYAFTLISRP